MARRLFFYFLSPFIKKRRKVATQCQPRTFCSQSQKQASVISAKCYLSQVLSQPSDEIHPPLPVPPFLLVQNLSPKDIAGSDITSRELYDAYKHLE